MYDLKIALESLDSAVESLFKNKNDSKSTKEYTQSMAKSILRSESPLTGKLPISFSWYLITNIQDLYKDFSLKHGDVNLHKFEKYARKNLKIEAKFVLRRYDKVNGAIRETVFDENASNPLLKRIFGLDVKKAIDDCTTDTVNKLFKICEQTEDRNTILPMGSVLVANYNYIDLARTKTLYIKSILTTETLLYGETFVDGKEKAIEAIDESTNINLKDPETVRALNTDDSYKYNFYQTFQ